MKKIAKTVLYFVLAMSTACGYYHFVYKQHDIEHFNPALAIQVMANKKGLDDIQKRDVLKIHWNSMRISNLEKTHENVSQLLHVLSKTIAGMNKETAQEFGESGKVLRDNAWLQENKKAIKLAVLQYLSENDLSEEKTDEIFPLKNQNIQAINFVFVKREFKKVKMNKDKSAISNSLVNIDNEISDMFDISVNDESISKQLYDQLRHKHENVFADKIAEFARSYVRESNDKVFIDDRIVMDWLKIYPKDRSYTAKNKGAILTHITKKMGYFVALINENE